MFNQVYNKMWKDQQNTAIQRQGRENGSKPQQNLLLYMGKLLTDSEGC